MAKRIQIHGDLLTNPVLKTGSKTFGITLSEQPTSTVTITFDSTNEYFTHTVSLSFTTLNWATPQTLTITGVTSADVFGLRKDVLTATCSGGGYDSVTLSQGLIIYDTGIDIKFLTGWRWLNEIKTFSGFRDNLISDLFVGGFPSNNTPTTSDIGFSGLTAHGLTVADITGWSTIDRHLFTRQDIDGYTWNHYVYLFHATTPNGKLVINHIGHGSEGADTHESFVSQLLALGYDVLQCAMPIDGLGRENNENNPTVRSNGSGTSNHNSILTGGLDRNGYLPLELFFFGQIEALNYLSGNYTEVIACGLSGGCLIVTMLAALDTRISKTFGVRGVKPRAFKVSPDTTSEPDYEQGGSLTSSTNCGPRVYDFYTTNTWMMIMIMAASGGRSYKYLTHYQDTVGMGGFTYKLWLEKAQSFLSQNGGGAFSLFFNPEAGESAHMYQPAEVANIIADL